MEEIVSVIIPVYNRGNILSRSIDSVINQNYKNMEIIIVDDHSTDNTKSIIDKYVKKDSRIKCFSNYNKKGPAGARNVGLKEATGTYVAFLDSDDEWVPFHIAESVEIIEERGVDLCFSLWYEKSRNGQCKERFGDDIGRQRIDKMIADLNPKKQGDLLMFGDDFIEYAILERCYCYHINTLVFKRSIVKNKLFFNENLRTNEDLDFTIHLFDLSKICLIRKCHFTYYQGNDNLYSFMDRKNIVLSDILGNQVLIGKMTCCDYNKAKMFKLRKKFIKDANKITHKKECIRECNDRIAKKYFTLGILNQTVRPFYAIFFIIRSMRYEMRWYKLKSIFKILCRKDCIDVPQDSLYFT